MTGGTFGLCASCFFFLKDEELAQNIVEDHDDDVGRELHHHIVPPEQIDAQVHKEHIQKSRTDARAEKRGELPADLLCALRLAVEHPAAVRHIRKQHAQNPCDGGAEYRTAAERMREQPVGDIVYRRREHAEDHIGNEILVFRIESLQLFVHFLTSKSDPARNFPGRRPMMAAQEYGYSIIFFVLPAEFFTSFPDGPRRPCTGEAVREYRRCRRRAGGFRGTR